MDSMFKFNLENTKIEFFKNKSVKEKNYLKTDIFYVNDYSFEENNGVDADKYLYKNVFFLKRLFLSQNEKYLLKSITLINEEKFDEALSIIKNHNKDGNYLIDIYFVLLLLDPDRPDKKDILNKIIADIDLLGDFLKKYKIGISIQFSLSDHIFMRFRGNRAVMLLYLVFNQFRYGHPKEALEILLKIEEENDKNNPLIDLLLGELFIKTGQLDKAIILLQNIKASNIICIYSLLLLGKAFRKMGLLKSSIAVLRKTRRRSSRYPNKLNLEGRYQLAISLEKYNKSFLAKKEYEKILTTSYNYKDTKKRLYSLKNI
ncbi:MAG: tetratricopeptide repeat protein [bacterium]